MILNKPRKWLSRLIKKNVLTEKVIYFEFSVPFKDFAFEPGQFVGIKVPTRNVPRAYSIVDFDSKNLVLSFLIDISPQGVNSKYFEGMNIGDEVEISGPFGVFKLRDSNFNKVFVCTSTGIAPFLPMFSKLFISNFSGLITLFFGFRYFKDDFLDSFVENFINKDNFEYFKCISKEENLKNNFDLNPKVFAGRVTNCIEYLFLKKTFDFTNSEFYLCGSSEMVEDVKNLLLKLNVRKENILFEKYN